MGSRTVNRLAVTLALLLMPSMSGAQEQAAQRPVGVIELFTSQGCNSCPPADELLGEMAARGDVVALAYHVDYWDYLGWRDTLARPDNTARQKEYNEAFGSRSVYTPQAVINGRVHVNGAKRAKVAGALERMAGPDRGLSVDVAVSYTADSIVIETGAAPRPVREAHLMLVYFSPATTVQIERGKNQGKSYVYSNAVSGFHSAGMWHGKAARFELPLSEVAKKAKGGYAVLVQEMGKDGRPGAILGAAISTPQAGW